MKKYILDLYFYGITVFFLFSLFLVALTEMPIYYNLKVLDFIIIVETKPFFMICYSIGYIINIMTIYSLILG